MWGFETDPGYQADLDWADEFVREEVEPLEFAIPNVLDTADPVRQELVPPLQARVRERGLWATHLGPELGGQGHGQVKLALLNEMFPTYHRPLLRDQALKRYADVLARHGRL